MNLYAINFAHYAPRGSHHGIEKYIVADTEEEVFNIVAKLAHWEDYENVVINENGDFVYADDGEEYDGYLNWYDEDGKPELFKDRMMRLGGELYDDSLELSDLYYGATLYGWELIAENISNEEYGMLINLGILEDGKE